MTVHDTKYYDDCEEIEKLVKSIRNHEETLVLMYDRYKELIKPCNQSSCNSFFADAEMNCEDFTLVTECPDYDYTWIIPGIGDPRDS